MTETISSLVATGRTREGVLFEGPERATPYTFSEFCTNAWKAASLLRQYGAHRGSTVAVVFSPGTETPPGSGETVGLETVQPVLGFLGGALLGAQVDISPSSPVTARTFVRPVGNAWHERYDTSAGCSNLGYGGSPSDPAVTGFEGALWGQNPTEPPESVDPDTIAICCDGHEYTHEALLETAEWIITEYEVDEASRVGIRADIRRPATLVGGVLVPLATGASVVLGDPEATTVDITIQSGESAGSGDEPENIPISAIDDRLDTV